MKTSPAIPDRQARWVLERQWLEYLEDASPRIIAATITIAGIIAAIWRTT